MEAPLNKFVTYKRVSTQKQKDQGDSFVIQQGIIEKFLTQNNFGNYEIVGNYEEVETGTGRKKRKIVYDAINFCKENNATLIVATLWRFSRDNNFLEQVFNMNVEFIACDFPLLKDAALNRLILTIFVAVGAYEAAAIRERVRNGVRHAISKGKLVGYPGHKNKNNNLAHGRKQSAISRQGAAANNVNNTTSLLAIQQLKSDDKSWAEVATLLNTAGFRTSRGRLWGRQTVRQKAGG